MHMIFIVLIWFTFFFYDPDFFGALPAIWCPTQCALCAFAELRHCTHTHYTLFLSHTDTHTETRSDTNTGNSVMGN